MSAAFPSPRSLPFILTTHVTLRWASQAINLESTQVSQSNTQGSDSVRAGTALHAGHPFVQLTLSRLAEFPPLSFETLHCLGHIIKLLNVQVCMYFICRNRKELEKTQHLY